MHVELMKGAAAGLIAASVVAALLLLQREFALLPQFDWIALIGALTGTGLAGGWLLHFVVGATWGALFAWLDPDLPGDSLRERGVVFGVLAWLAMMLTVMPLAGAGLFALKLGILTTLFTLVAHVIFGAVMGRLYAWLFVQMLPLRFHRR